MLCLRACSEPEPHVFWQGADRNQSLKREETPLDKAISSGALIAVPNDALQLFLFGLQDLLKFVQFTLRHFVFFSLPNTRLALPT